jgi:hypothetical protein
VYYYDKWGIALFLVIFAKVIILHPPSPAPNYWTTNSTTNTIQWSSTLNDAPSTISVTLVHFHHMDLEISDSTAVAIVQLHIQMVAICTCIYTCLTLQFCPAHIFLLWQWWSPIDCCVFFGLFMCTVSDRGWAAAAWDSSITWIPCSLISIIHPENLPSVLWDIAAAA